MPAGLPQPNSYYCLIHVSNQNYFCLFVLLYLFIQTPWFIQVVPTGMPQPARPRRPGRRPPLHLHGGAEQTTISLSLSIYIYMYLLLSSILLLSLLLFVVVVVVVVVVSVVVVVVVVAVVAVLSLLLLSSLLSGATTNRQRRTTRTINKYGQ